MPATLWLRSRDSDPKPGDRRDPDQPRYQEYGPPLRACPEADLWPVTLAFARDDPQNLGPYQYNVMVRWLAISPDGGVPKEQQTQIQTGYQCAFISDRDLPQELAARVYKEEAGPANTIQHLILSGLKAPAGEGGKGRAFRLFVTVEDAASGKAYFNTCVKYMTRIYDFMLLMDGNDGNRSSITADSDEFEKDAQKMHPNHEALLEYLKNRGYPIGDFGWLKTIGA